MGEQAGKQRLSSGLAVALPLPALPALPRIPCVFRGGVRAGAGGDSARHRPAVVVLNRPGAIPHPRNTPGCR